MSKPAFDLVVFDWDGTLMDSAPAITRSIQNACADLGLPVPTDERASYVIGLGLRDALEYAVPDLTRAQLPAMLERYRHHYGLQDAAGIGLFEGVEALLDTLAARQRLLGVATGKSRAGLDRVLAGTGLATRFHATRCADETHPKPDPAMLFELLARLDVAPGRALMIGDTTHDLQMAQRAGVAAVAVTYGAHPRAALQAAQPLACVDSVSALSAWLEQHT